jgi:triosephosphate isomerase
MRRFGGVAVVAVGRGWLPPVEPLTLRAFRGEGRQVIHGLRRPLVAANWKMHGTRAEARERARCVQDSSGILACDVVLAPPFVHLSAVVDELAGSGIAVAGQDASAHAKGAYTGEVSAAMLADLGCSYVILGHSECRAMHGDSDAVVVQKVKLALAAGLVPIVCVGETLQERESGHTADIVLRQAGAVLGALAVADVQRLLLAYEPVWAIGTGLQATPGQAQEVHGLLRQCVASFAEEAASSARILYGGSVKAANAPDLMGMPDVDGVLVGGASLDANEFLAICAAAR